MKLAQTRPFTSGTEEMGGVATFEGLNAIFQNTVSVALGLGAIIFFAMLVIGGFKYLTSGSDPQQAEAGKKTLTYAVGGIAFLILAVLILGLIKGVTGVDVLNFDIIVR